MCETCLYNKNCQFLAKHPKLTVDGCTAYKDATNIVEVVRCKDCKYFVEEEFCMGIGIICKFDDFCSYGERRDGVI